MDYDERKITGDWDYSSLPSNVRIGANCWIERRDSFSRFRSEQQSGLVLGDRVKVFTWTTFNIEPTGCVEIGSDSTIVGAVFMCAERIRTGQNVLISYHVMIADSDFHPMDPKLRIQDAIANSPLGNRENRPQVVSRPIAIGDDVSIGIGAIVLKGVYIGRGARIGSGAVVTRNVPDGAIVEGNPANVAT